MAVSQGSDVRTSDRDETVIARERDQQGHPAGMTGSSTVSETLGDVRGTWAVIGCE